MSTEQQSAAEHVVDRTGWPAGEWDGEQRSQEIGYEGAEYDDLLMLRATLACRIGELREQISEYCAPWFEVAR